MIYIYGYALRFRFYIFLRTMFVTTLCVNVPARATDRLSYVLATSKTAQSNVVRLYGRARAVAK